MNVLLPWVSGLSMMQQTVLLTAIRGPDGLPKYGPAKMLLRWYRRCILHSAMDRQHLTTPYQRGGGSFTGPSLEHIYKAARPLQKVDWRPQMDDIVGQYLREVDGIPHHFHLHWMHAVEILGYKYPDPDVRAWWHKVYLRLVHDMHLWPEKEEEMDRRLGDDREQWLARADEATVD